MAEILKKITDYLFPVKNTCNICKREIFNDDYFCSECEEKLTYNNGTICNHCGRSVFNSEEYCSSCNNRETYFDKARSAFIYRDDIRKLIIQLKYGGKKYLADIFAEKLSLIYYQNFFSCDFVVYTPMTKEAEKIRGYNQAEIIASEFCKLTHLELKKDVVIKVKETQQQATITSAKERRKNLAGVFKVADKKVVEGKNIVLIDDVMTTGTTVELISEDLKKAGAEKIFVLTVASVCLNGEEKND